MNRHTLRNRASAALVPLCLIGAACTSSSNADTTARDDDGEVVEGGQVGVFRLQEGDCVQLPAALLGVSSSATDEVEDVSDFEAVPCDESHDGEVVLVDDEYFADLEAFPSESESTSDAQPSCIEALDSYTGTDFESSPYAIIPLVPSSESWDSLDDRGLICIGATLSDDFSEVIETTGSIRSAG